MSVLQMILERVGEGVESEGDRYRVVEERDSYLIKEIIIGKEELRYAFIGGMWYYRGRFDLESDISLPYPFSTYYTLKIPDKRYNGRVCRSLIYTKMPVIALQFKDRCIFMEFDPVIEVKGKEIFPFISLHEDQSSYIISFHIFNRYSIKTKESAWLGFGKKRKICVGLKPGDSFEFRLRIKEIKDWKEGVRDFVSKKLPKEAKIEDPYRIFLKGKNALWRSFDSLTGTFLQLPWSRAPGFVFVNSSYSLPSFDAVRLHYFERWFRESGDEDFKEWSNRLRDIFKNPRLYKRGLRKGRGIIWYNMTNLAGDDLEGFFYMDCGYSGYPGGQATIAFHLLRFLEMEKDEELDRLVRESLDYIASTQKGNGSWPMAIRQEGFIRFRPEDLERFETHGGTAECVRALLLGYRRFGDGEMLERALRGLNYLDTEYPVCYHGLRDIGIREAEAFSAIAVMEAFMDAFEVLGKRDYLERALTYAYYALTWFYFYDTKQMELSFNFHPISESITPRISPYESLLLVSTYNRLSKLSGDPFWKDIAKILFVRTIRWTSENGGICEGIFPRFSNGLEPLPMEQTFATVELMNASTNFFRFQDKRDEHEKDIEEEDKDIEFVIRDGKKLILLLRGREKLVFDVEKFRIEPIDGVQMSEHGIFFSFFDPYSLSSSIKRRIKRFLRGRYGKFLLGLSEVKSFIWGVREPRIVREPKVYPLEKVKKKRFSVEIEKNNTAKIYYQTSLHRIESRIRALRENGKIRVLFDPLIIKVLGHDLSCKKVLFPVIEGKPERVEGRKIVFKGFSVFASSGRVMITEGFTAVDQTLSTNWTHGGIYKGALGIEIDAE